MNISYGICLGPNYNTEWLMTLVSSIILNYSIVGISNTSPKFEILIICPKEEYSKTRDALKNTIIGFEIITFDESQKRGWITRKKNILAKNAKYENICIVHDYYLFDSNWAKGVFQHTIEHPTWDVLTNVIYRAEGDRHSDWLVAQQYTETMLRDYPHLAKEMLAAATENGVLGENNGPKWVCGLPYSENRLTHLQYISGGFIFGRARMFHDFPFDERYGWGEAPEDLIWSRQIITAGAKIQFNKYSSVRLQKKGKWRVYEMPESAISALKTMYGESSNGT